VTPTEQARTGRNVLISSASRKVPLVRSVISAARRLDPAIRVLAGDLDTHALARFVADGFVRLPRTESTNVQEILDLCHTYGVGTIIPTRDGELPFWAGHAPIFRACGIEVVVSAPAAIAVCVDKLRFAEHGAAVGLPLIAAWLQPQGGGPFVVKERFGAGSRSLGLNLETGAARAHARALSAPIFQPFVEGIEISADAWIDRAHRIKGLVLRTRDEVFDGESAVTTTFRDAALEAVCRHVLESLPLRGPVVMQLFRDRDGQAHIIELNARFGGASTASIAAGLDSWFWTLGEADGRNLDNEPFQRIDGEVRQIRVPSDLYIHDPRF
jgi:carbamoyl-phosphate synthase large subunit